MQPIIMLAVVAVAAGALGVGFLGNTIDLTMVQTIGVGMTDLESDVIKANVDFTIEKVNALGNAGVPAFKNIISECIVQNYDPETMMAVNFVPYSTVICKLTDINNNVVAEGEVMIPTAPATMKVTVPIGQPPGLPNNVKNVHDVIIVVRGASQVMGD